MVENYVRRVNIYGGPGIGKSTVASELYSHFNKLSAYQPHQTQFELVQEFVKNWAWQGRDVKGMEQVYVFACQQHREEMALLNGVDCVFTDSPLYLNVTYAKKFHSHTYNALEQLSHTHEQIYPGLHILLERKNKPYSNKGRYEDENAARRMDEYIRETLDTCIGSNNYYCIPYNNIDDMCVCISEIFNI